jgi:hypothetical protein
MLKGLVACIILSGIALPARAGDRPAISKAVAGRTSVQPFLLPAGTAKLQPLPPVTLQANQVPKRTGEEPAIWGPGSTLPEVTARDGGSYAVYDVLRAQPRPRHRNSALSAALVLRLDGQDDSPAFSIGGGGVAAAVWRAVPR